MVKKRKLGPRHEYSDVEEFSTLPPKGKKGRPRSPLWDRFEKLEVGKCFTTTNRSVSNYATTCNRKYPDKKFLVRRSGTTEEGKLQWSVYCVSADYEEDE